MKKFALAVLALSFSAVADVNPEIAAIFKKYDSYLMNLKPGMTALSQIENTDLVLNEQGELEARMETSQSKKIVLKVMGTKTYTLEQTINMTTGEETAEVTLEDHAYTDEDGTEFRNVREENQTLTASFSSDESDEEYRFAIEGVVTKKLTSPIVCDMSLNVKGTYTLLSTQQTVNYVSNSNSVCGDDMPIAEMKKLDLTSVEFCDFTAPESDEESNCNVQDMSHLIKEL